MLGTLSPDCLATSSGQEPRIGRFTDLKKMQKQVTWKSCWIGCSGEVVGGSPRQDPTWIQNGRDFKGSSNAKTKLDPK